MRIKKKESVLPFRETVAFRMLLLSGSILVFITALFILAFSLRTSLTWTIVAGIVTVAAAITVFYNLDHMRDAKIPKQTLTRMKRR